MSVASSANPRRSARSVVIRLGAGGVSSWRISDSCFGSLGRAHGHEGGLTAVPEEQFGCRLPAECQVMESQGVSTLTRSHFRATGSRSRRGLRARSCREPVACRPLPPRLLSRVSRLLLHSRPCEPADGRHHPHGQARVALQAARIRLPVVRDLRRPRLRVGLRPAGRRAQEERQGPLVAGHGPRPRRHRGTRRRHPDAPQGVGGLRARGGLHRPAGGLQDLQGALPGRQDPGRAVPAEAEQAPGRAHAPASSPSPACST